MMLTPQQPTSKSEISIRIQENLHLVDIIVARMTTQVPSFMNRDDMHSAGLEGLMNAAGRFDPEKKIKFKTFAEYRIRGAIYDEMRKLDWFSRTLREKQSRISRTLRELELQLARDPEDSEVAQALDMPLAEYQQLLGEVSHLGCVSLNQTLDNSNEGRTFLDALADERDGYDPGDALENQQVTAKIAEVIETLKEKERLVISLYYYEELTQKEIAEVMDLSEGRISQLHSQALIKLRNKVELRLD
jgi:RNA polymerase sigma factor for flagellar operon FliA